MKLLYLALAMLFATSSDVFAQDAFSTVVGKGKTLFSSVRTVVFVMGGFGLVGLAVGAIFGAVKWKWFASLAFGLLILAIASQVVNAKSRKRGARPPSFFVARRRNDFLFVFFEHILYKGFIHLLRIV